MPINIEDTLWMRQKRIEQAQQERMAAMSQIAEGSAQVNAIQQRAFEQEMESAPQAGALAQQLGGPQPQYANPRLQRQAQMGAQGAMVQQAMWQRAQTVEQQARQQSEQFDLRKLTYEWAQRTDMGSAEREAALKMEQERQKAANYRAGIEKKLAEDRIAMDTRRVELAENKEERDLLKEKLNIIRTVSQFMKSYPKNPITGKWDDISKLPGPVQSGISDLIKLVGGTVQEHLATISAAAENPALLPALPVWAAGGPAPRPGASMMEKNESLRARKRAQWELGVE